MKKRFSDEQINSILREAEAGVSVRELCRKHAISDATFFPRLNHALINTAVLHQIAWRLRGGARQHQNDPQRYPGIRGWYQTQYQDSRVTVVSALAAAWSSEHRSTCNTDGPRMFITQCRQYVQLGINLINMMAQDCSSRAPAVVTDTLRVVLVSRRICIRSSCLEIACSVRAGSRRAGRQRA